MTAVKEHRCRLCLSFKTNEKFEVIDNFTRDVLIVLSIELKLEESKTYIMCTTCSGKLKAALEFKSTCLATGDTIYPYIDCENKLQLDLREIYMKEIENKDDMDLPEDQKVCSLCMQLANEYIDVHEQVVNAIQKFLPEMNMGVIKYPVVCRHCYDSLDTHNSFLNDCLETEKKNGCIEISQSDIQSFDAFVKMDDIKTEVKDSEETQLKSECTEVKSEEKQQGDTHLVELKEEIIEGDTCPKMELDHLLKLEMYPSYTNQLDAQVHNGEKREDPLDITPHMSKYENPKSPDLPQKDTQKSHLTEIFKCKECEYQSPCKRYFRAHQMRHDKHKEGPTYQCGKCYFKSKSWKSLRVHEVIHKQGEKPQMYKCEHCEYHSTVRFSFRQHQLTHEEHEGTTIFKCDQCEYRSKKKKYLNNHRMRHEDRKATRMYACDKCEYRSKVRMNFREHVLRHEESKGTQLYKCDKCEYESKQKKNFYKHLQRHKESEEM